MAQDQTVTNEGIAELVLVWGGGAGTVMKSIACMTDTTACTVSSTHTFASPPDTIVSSTVAAALDTVNLDAVATTATNTAGDSITFDHVFTSTGTFNITGVVVMNDDDDCAYVICCFASVVNMEATDTLTIDGKVVIDQAST